MADTEFDEPGRAELIQRIAAAMFADQEIKLSSALWAFLWLADYSCLEKIERDIADPVLRAKFDSLMGDVLLPWICKSKNKSTMATPTESVANTPTGDYARKRPRLSVDTAAAVQSSSPQTPTRSSFPQIPSSGPSTPKQSGRKYRDPKLREMTLGRDFGCVITKIKNLTVVEHAHIYPNSLGPAGERQAFWEQLKLFWPQKQVEQWHNLLGTLQGTESLVNTISMNVLVHKAWGAALFALKHLNTSEDKFSMKLQFYWLRPASKPNLTVEEFLKKPSLPSDEQCGEGSLYLYNVRAHQPIKSGDIITLSTLSPLTKPLPSEELINLQWNLHRIAALSAAAIDHELEIMGDDDDDDYDEDLY